MIEALCAQGVTQGQLSVLTRIPPGRLSECKDHTRTPAATSTFEVFADGLRMPSAARRTLGLDPDASGSSPPGCAGGRPDDIAGRGTGDVRPVLSTLSRASAIPVLSALQEIHRGYFEADRPVGAMCITGPIQFQMPLVERACEVRDG